MGIAAYNRGTVVLRRELDAVTVQYQRREDRMVAKVTLAIEHGIILRAYNALDREETTIGPYQEAVDRSNRYAVIGWRSGRQSEFSSARSAAMLFVHRVGTTRANDCVKALR